MVGIYIYIIMDHQKGTFLARFSVSRGEQTTLPISPVSIRRVISMCRGQLLHLSPLFESKKMLLSLYFSNSFRYIFSKDTYLSIFRSSIFVSFYIFFFSFLSFSSSPFSIQFHQMRFSIQITR